MAHSEQPKEHSIKGGTEVCIGEDCKICKERSFERWFAELLNKLMSGYGWTKLAAYSSDKDAFYEMFENGLSVDDAIHEELSV